MKEQIGNMKDADGINRGESDDTDWRGSARPLTIREQNDVAVTACAEYSGKDSIGLCLDPFDLRGH